MNLKTKLAAGIIMLAGISAAQATTYDVHGIFSESATGGVNTEFVGNFDANWDGANWSISNFMGTMNEAMRGAWTADAGHEYIDGNAPAGMPGMTMYPNFMLSLDDTNGMLTTDNGSVVTATIFRGGTVAGQEMDVYYGGGIDITAGAEYLKAGYNAAGFIPADGLIANENAFFTLAFEHDGMGNITSMGLQEFGTNTALVNEMAYGDCTLGSLMQAGNACMAGEPTGLSTMAGLPASIAISEVSAVPVPAAAWLFGGALMSLFGANRRKNVLPA